MPQLSQGDVFVSVDTSRAELAVVFGHIGFNEMHQRWAASVARTERSVFRDNLGKWLTIAVAE